MTRQHTGVTRERIRAYVVAHIVEHGFAPTVREIGDGLGLRSTGTVQMHLAQLVAEGKLRQPRPTVFTLPAEQWGAIVAAYTDQYGEVS